MKNVLKKGIAFTLALTLSVSSANVSPFITKADQQAEGNSANFAKMWQKHFGGETYAYKGKTDYTQINCKKGLNRANMFLYEWLHGTKKSLELQQDNIL